jgi:hypothetical protein
MVYTASALPTRSIIESCLKIRIEDSSTWLSCKPGNGGQRIVDAPTVICVLSWAFEIAFSWRTCRSLRTKCSPRGRMFYRGSSIGVVVAFALTMLLHSVLDACFHSHVTARELRYIRIQKTEIAVILQSTYKLAAKQRSNTGKCSIVPRAGVS